MRGSRITLALRWGLDQLLPAHEIIGIDSKVCKSSQAERGRQHVDGNLPRFRVRVDRGRIGANYRHGRCADSLGK